jgi:hypothetical protein
VARKTVVPEPTSKLVAEMRRLEREHRCAVEEYRDDDARQLAATIMAKLPALLDAAEAHLAERDKLAHGERIKPGGSPPMVKP